MNPLISVILPVYNAAPYLEEALVSLFVQTATAFEIIAVDDGSEDESPYLLDRWRQRDPRLRVLRNERRLRLSGALNRGLTEARGAFVARMDADDRARPWRLAMQAHFLTLHPSVDFCGTAIRRFGTVRSHTLRYPIDHDTICAFALFDTPLCHPTAMWRRVAFERAGLLYDGRFYPSEDYDLWVRALTSLRGANLPDVLLDYRVRAGSMTSAEWSEMDEQAARIAERQLRPLGLSPTPEDLRRHRRIALHRPAKTLAELAEMDRWLQRIAEANAYRGHYHDAALRAVLRDFWWQSCMNSTALGVGVWRLNRRATFRARGIHAAWLALSILRRAGARARASHAHFAHHSG